MTSEIDKNGKLYIFNSYCNGRIVNEIYGGKIYYNNIKKPIDVKSELNLKAITEKIDTSKQVANISINIGNIKFKSSKWNSKIWIPGKKNSNGNNRFPKLRVNKSIKSTVKKISNYKKNIKLLKI